MCNAFIRDNFVGRGHPEGILFVFYLFCLHRAGMSVCILWYWFITVRKQYRHDRAARTADGIYATTHTIHQYAMLRATHDWCVNEGEDRNKTYIDPNVIEFWTKKKQK